MFQSSALEVALGLIFTYLVLSIVCTGLSEATANVRGVRGRLFREYVEGFVGDPWLVKQMYEHPFIVAFTERSGPTWLPNASRRVHYPSEIPGELLAAMLVDVADMPPVWHDDKIEEALDKIPSFQTRGILMSIARRTEGGIEEVHAVLGRLFDWGTLLVRDRVRRRTRFYLWFWALALAIALNVDTTRIAEVLWNQAGGNPVESLPLGWSMDTDDPTGPPTSFSEAIPKLVGLFVTAGAVTFGADFWLSLLERLTRVHPRRDDKGDQDGDDRRR